MNLVLTLATVCPKAPPGADIPAGDIQGYVLWGVGLLFLVGVVIGVGAILAGRIFNSPHASKAGVVSLVVVLLAAVAYVTLPGIVQGVLGTGCIS